MTIKTAERLTSLVKIAGLLWLLSIDARIAIGVFLMAGVVFHGEEEFHLHI